jgi:hypothetical protein
VQRFETSSFQQKYTFCHAHAPKTTKLKNKNEKRFLREADPEIAAHTAAGAAAFRAVAEDALTAAGLHVAGGARVWAAFRYVCASCCCCCFDRVSLWPLLAVFLLA